MGPCVVRVPAGPWVAKEPAGLCVAGVPAGLCVVRVSVGPCVARVPKGPCIARVPTGPCVARVPTGPCVAIVPTEPLVARVLLSGFLHMTSCPTLSWVATAGTVVLTDHSSVLLLIYVMNFVEQVHTKICNGVSNSWRIPDERFASGIFLNYSIEMTNAVKWLLFAAQKFRSCGGLQNFTT